MAREWKLVYRDCNVMLKQNQNKRYLYLHEKEKIWLCIYLDYKEKENFSEFSFTHFWICWEKHMHDYSQYRNDYCYYY
jgi:hypothetical protein